MNNLSYLIESELEKAEIILAAKSITDSIQKMAENAAKMEAENVMPLNDPIREHYGPEAADKFAEAVGEALRTLTHAISDAKNTISNEIARVQGEVVESNDLDNMGDDEFEPEAEGDEMDATGEEDDPFGDIGTDADLEGGAEEPRFDDEEFANAAGRARKESVETLKKPLSDPDALVASEYAKLVREGKSPKRAAMIVTETYAINLNTLIEIVEAKSKS